MMCARPALILVSIIAWSVALASAAPVGCSDNEEVYWETAVSAAGALAADEKAEEERFRDFGVAVTNALDEMNGSLIEARRGVSVVDRPELDALSIRVAILRDDFVKSTGRTGSSARRGELEAEFETLLGDIESFLLRVGHSEDEFARWRAVE